MLVDKLPGDAVDPDELRAFFSKYGEVADVAIGLNNGRLIELFQKRGKLDIQIEEQAAQLKLYKLQSMQVGQRPRGLTRSIASIPAIPDERDEPALLCHGRLNDASLLCR